MNDWDKLAQHALDRVKERTSLDPNVIPFLEAEADRLSGQVPPGFYFVPLKGQAGELAGYAAFKTVPGYPHEKLVLATILAPHMTPKGTSLAHVMNLPPLPPTLKAASVVQAGSGPVFDPNVDSPYHRVMRQRFNEMAETVRSQGAFAGTAHRRVLIPKSKLTERDINALGFTPVTIAIPEAGQDRFQSFRHPDNNFHIHSHPDGWTMHEDSHAAATMMAKKAPDVKSKAKAMIDGLPHVNEEGIPGLYYYMKGVLGGHKSTAHRVFKELPHEVKLKMFGMPSSPTADAQAALEGVKQSMLDLEKVAELVAKIRSSRDKRRKYQVHKEGEKYTCTCPDYTYRQAKVNGHCKHIKEHLGAAPLQEKLAKILTELKPHQQRVVDRMADPNQTGLVAVHGLGSGKTLTSIAVADKLGLPADVVVPAALQGNYAKELAKHTDVPPDTNIQSIENVARKGHTALTRPLIIVDEAHRMRNQGKTQSALMNSGADKRLLLTGSLFYNHPSDMAAPINMAAGSKVLPNNPAEFSGRFIRERYVKPGIFGQIAGKPGETVVEVNPHEKQHLRELLGKYVDYHPGSTEGFPTREDQVIKVEMSPEQRKIYDHVMKDAPQWVREKILKNLPPTKSEAKQLNSFLTGVRQVSNSTNAYDIVNTPHEPKVDRAVQELQKLMETNPEAKAVVYSNFLPSGINPYKQRLDDLKIPYGEFTGQMTKSVRDQLVRDYNENKLKALLLSSAGGEGLDLKGTNLIQLLEPHWNEEKMKQVIGRGIRFKSHDHLPEEQRKVLIQRFLATRPRVGMLEKLKLKDPGGSVDEYLHSRSQEKEQLNQQFRELLN